MATYSSSIKVKLESIPVLFFVAELFFFNCLETIYYSPCLGRSSDRGCLRRNGNKNVKQYNTLSVLVSDKTYCFLFVAKQRNKFKQNEGR